MELNLRTCIFIMVASALFIYKNISSHKQHSSCAMQKNDLSNLHQRQETLKAKLCDSWVIRTGDFRKNLDVLLERNGLKSILKGQEYFFKEDQTIYIQSIKPHTKTQKKVSLSEFGYWYLEGDFLFILINQASGKRIEQVKIFKVHELGKNRLILEETKKYASYDEFRDKLDKQLDLISQNRREIISTTQLNKKEKIIRLIKLQDEFFHYPN
ncbi:MAG: hypothetical protein NW226_15070 [Microscillaceae bacterium]|nr:hypothetical protein [Microscillaceae bacterium]